MSVSKRIITSFIFANLIMLSSSMMNFESFYGAYQTKSKTTNSPLDNMTQADVELLFQTTVFNDYLSDFQLFHQDENLAFSFSANYTLRPEAKFIMKHYQQTHEIRRARVTVHITDDISFAESMEAAAKKMAFTTCNKININPGSYKESFIYEPLKRINHDGQLEEVEQISSKTGHVYGSTVGDFDVIGHITGHHEPGFAYIQQFFEMSFYKLNFENEGKEFFIIVQVMSDFNGYLLDFNFPTIINNPNYHKSDYLTFETQTMRRMTSLFNDMNLLELVDLDLNPKSIGWIQDDYGIKPQLLLSNNLKVTYYDNVTDHDLLTESIVMFKLLQQFFKKNDLDKLNSSSIPGKIMNGWNQMFSQQTPFPDGFASVVKEYMDHNTKLNLLGGKTNRILV